MQTWRLFGVALLGLLAGACNDILGNRLGRPIEDEDANCTTTIDCEVEVSEPECRIVSACNGGECIFDDAPDGTQLMEQTQDDCAVIVCNGMGATRIEALSADIEDDGNPCTLDACEGTKPTHTLQQMLACYSGLSGTAGKGICVAGVQQCDAGGKPLGGCTGEVPPEKENCISELDEDCDGQANEEGDGCVCVPGAQQPCYTGPAGTDVIGVCQSGMQACASTGLTWGPCVGEVTPITEDCDAGGVDEDCDGKINESGPSCYCGDGDISNGEECDDSNPSDADSCSSMCKSLAVLAVAAGSRHTCALLPGGSVKCWGNNYYGQLGLGDTTQRGDGPNEMGAALPTVDLGPGVAATAIAMGDFHACALLFDGSVKCWGNNAYGQLGLGDINNRGDESNEMGAALPSIDLGPGAKATAITAGYNYSCAILTGGGAKCWGIGGNGQLGLGDASNRGDQANEMGAALPVIDLGPSAMVTAIVAGDAHTCALLAGGNIKCWGYNAYGQLGLGDTTQRGDSPDEMGAALPTINLGPGVTATAIALGNFHTCALLAGGSVKCWGRNHAGYLGLGDTDPRGDEPSEMGAALLAIDIASGATAIAAGFGHTCALLTGGDIKCWGGNYSGQLGLGDIDHRGDGLNEMGADLPLLNLGPAAKATAVAASGSHTCARITTGNVKCWGYNEMGQLGLGDIGNRGDEPNEMGNSLPFVELNL